MFSNKVFLNYTANCNMFTNINEINCFAVNLSLFVSFWLLVILLSIRNLMLLLPL